MRRSKAAIIVIVAIFSMAAFAVLAPVVPTNVGSNFHCTTQQIGSKDFSWGHGGCYSPGYASLTWYHFGYGAYFTLGAYVPPIHRGPQ